jgi:hypothetical protein
MPASPAGKMLPDLWFRLLGQPEECIVGDGAMVFSVTIAAWSAG